MKGKKQKIILVGALFLPVMLLVYLSVNRSVGVEDYQIIHCQLYEAYTEQYPYLDAIALGYVQVDGLKRKIQDEINEQIYSSVFKRANYWHYQPDEEVKLLQEDRLQDIFRFNEKFYQMWMERSVEQEERNEAVLESIEKWFSGKVKNEEYEIVPFYYVDAEKQFIWLGKEASIWGFWEDRDWEFR